MTLSSGGLWPAGSCFQWSSASVWCCSISHSSHILTASYWLRICIITCIITKISSVVVSSTITPLYATCKLFHTPFAFSSDSFLAFPVITCNGLFFFFSIKNSHPLLSSHGVLSHLACHVWHRVWISVRRLHLDIHWVENLTIRTFPGLGRFEISWLVWDVDLFRVVNLGGCPSGNSVGYNDENSVVGSEVCFCMLLSFMLSLMNFCWADQEHTFPHPFRSFHFERKKKNRSQTFILFFTRLTLVQTFVLQPIKMNGILVIVLLKLPHLHAHWFDAGAKSKGWMWWLKGKLKVL